MAAMVSSKIKIQSHAEAQRTQRKTKSKCSSPGNPRSVPAWNGHDTDSTSSGRGGYRPRWCRPESKYSLSQRRRERREKQNQEKDLTQKAVVSRGGSPPLSALSLLSALQDLFLSVSQRLSVSAVNNQPRRGGRPPRSRLGPPRPPSRRGPPLSCLGGPDGLLGGGTYGTSGRLAIPAG
jgi:hypothetical protein